MLYCKFVLHCINLYKSKTISPKAIFHVFYASLQYSLQCLCVNVFYIYKSPNWFNTNIKNINNYYYRIIAFTFVAGSAALNIKIRIFFVEITKLCTILSML